MTLRWGVFFFIVAIIAALASLGAFGGGAAAEVGGSHVGIAEILLLTMLAFGAAEFVGWIAFVAQKQKRGEDDMPAERPWQIEDDVDEDDEEIAAPASAASESSESTAHESERERDERAQAPARSPNERPSGLR